ncbi:unnamed protein product [Blepharisma stoltei]|uniref:O-methyltransferase C-terminal domain-containing protein n=1 Tax=Blepharisma stoltei TaxID=1481888 RepID=A0AAU9J4G2_9CILI|nr:unnamed protein product [Blepharisma stoltei]
MDAVTIRSKIFQVLIGPQLAAMLYASLELELPELLLTPKSIEFLSEKTQTLSEKLERILFALESFGFFSYNSVSKEWSNSQLSSALLDESLNSIAKYCIMPYKYEVLCNFSESLKQEKSAHEIRFGCSYIEGLKRNQDAFEIYQKAMAGWTNYDGKDKIDIDLNDSSRVLDVGGGDGTLLIDLANAHPHITGTVFDIPESQPLIDANIEKYELSERLDSIGGNFFESLPEEYDCILIKNTLIDWSDRDCKRILNNCRKALEEGDQLKWIDCVIDRQDQTDLWGVILDMNMMASGNGRVRTKEQMEKLLHESGFRFDSISPSTKKRNASVTSLAPSAKHCVINAIAI